MLVNIMTSSSVKFPLFLLPPTAEEGFSMVLLPTSTSRGFVSERLGDRRAFFLDHISFSLVLP
jgi:hypothetical protein